MSDVTDVDNVGIQYPIQGASPKALQRVESWDVHSEAEEVKQTKNPFPFGILPLGQCFIVRFDQGNEKNIRNRVSKRNKVGQKQFIVIKHNEFQCYEVARVK